MVIIKCGGDRMRIFIKGYLDNLTDNNHISIDSKGIKDHNKIQYFEDNTKNTIIIKDDTITITRESTEFQNTIPFRLNEVTISTYYLKDNDLTIELSIKTNHINITDDTIIINYTVLESLCEYEYNIEMRNIYEYKKQTNTYYKM